MDELQILPVINKRTLRRFIMLPKELHKNHKNWVPPIYRDEWNYFNPKKNYAFDYCDYVSAICLKEGHPVGRIMGIINHRHNKSQNEKKARFSFFECINNHSVAHALLQYVETWAKSKGMEKIVGPYGMYYHDPEGFIIEGFEHEPAVATNYNFQYQVEFVEKEGYTPEVDFVVYKINIPSEIPSFYQEIFERTIKRKNFQLLEFSKKAPLKNYIRPVFNLMNDCYRDIYGYSMLDDKEMDSLGKQYLSFLDPRFIKIVTRQDELAGFIIAMPNISEGIRKANGYLLPFGIFKILNAAGKSKQLDLLIGGVKKEYQGIGLDVLLGLKMIETGQKYGFSFMDSHLELESNYKIRAEMEKVGGVVYKKYRVFTKFLDKVKVSQV